MSMREPLADRAGRARRPGIARHRTTGQPPTRTDAAALPHPGIDRGTLLGTRGADGTARPLPAIGGQQARWICEYCYAMAFREDPPPSWGTVVGTGAVCGDCRERIEA